MHRAATYAHAHTHQCCSFPRTAQASLTLACGCQLSTPCHRESPSPAITLSALAASAIICSSPCPLPRSACMLSEQANAAALGINPSSKLKYAIGTGGANAGSLGAGGTLRRQAGWVDFSPVRSLSPGAAPNYFPPTRFTPGSVGQGGYSPLVVIANEVYNAPIIAGNVSASTLNRYCRGIPANESAAAYRLVHDKVVAICAQEGKGSATVTLQLTQGFSFAKPVLYLRCELGWPT
jgi:hypothetical protein